MRSAPPPAPAPTARSPPFRSPPPAPAARAPAPPSPVSRRPPPPPVNRVGEGIAKMNIGSAPRPAPSNTAPAFSPANLRKTGIDMTGQTPRAPPPPPATSNTQKSSQIMGRSAPEIRRPAPPSPTISEQKIPSSTGLKSVNGRWKFPADSQLPEPPKFEGSRKIYPSGRTTGTTVMPSTNHASVAKATSPRPSPRLPAVDQTPAEPIKASVKKLFGSTNNSADLIDEKITALNSELKNAVAREEFEACIDLRGRIKKLKILREQVDDGFEISTAEIKSV